MGEKKKSVMDKPKIEVIRFSNGDVLTASGEPALTHGSKDELMNFGISGNFNTQNWYRDGQQS